MKSPIAQNTLFYGDNLPILREYIPDESVDLIYLDPPFNSNRSYNVLFKDESGKDSESQITAFEDTWHWNESAEQAYHELTIEIGGEVGALIGALRSFTGNNQMMAYLVMMAVRLVELHQVLKPTGSLYLHCDPTASHYLKILLDAIFGKTNFRNEIIWYYGPKATQNAGHFQRKHDVILYYSKSKEVTFNTLLQDYSEGSLEERDTRYKFEDDDGKYRLTTRRNSSGERYRAKVYLRPGVAMTDVWDINIINATAKERLGYPTQKPEALLERIIKASSNEGDIILDPFCGCGTTIATAQKLKRRWIGIDITYLSISLLKYRLKDMFGDIAYKVIGEPNDLGSARQLAQDNRYQFQWWAGSLIKAKPLGGQAGSKIGKKGSDKGIDGEIVFIDEAQAPPKKILVQVKSGHVTSGHIRDLRGTLERENAAMGVYITLDEPTRDMRTEATAAGYYESPGWGQKYPKLQILTIAELLRGAGLKMPPTNISFRAAERVKEEGHQQKSLFDSQ